ncbi:DMT family transporter [Vibrio sp. SCSIO 43133]|uniref:DMT family transporter n=1 Tax=Vibrio sp. SCSIO 43133 TaxID=2802577 RepID=UPI00207575A5|nr:DMT family transporter [Vibrio sp. SCSIO 43133]USE01748.1 DMT family transporter [Vibrio sp. SCSIO 43133]
MSNITRNSSLPVSKRAKGFSLAVAGAMLMSLDPIFIRYAQVSSFDTAFLFGLFSAVSMPLVLKLNDNRGIKKAVQSSGWPLLVAGLLMVGSASGLIFSVKNTSIANTFIILSTTPAIAAIFSRLWLKEHISKATMVAIFGVMIGIATVVSGSMSTGTWFGDLLAMFSVICLSFMFTLLRKYQNVSRLAAVGLGGMLLALVMLPFTVPSAYSMETWLIMALMGLITAPAGRVLSMVSTRYITAPEVSMTLMLETVLAPIWALTFFHEIPANASIVGGAIILATIFLYTKFALSNHQ